MLQSFIYSLQSEWLKTRRTLASWLVLLGGLLIPAIALIGQFSNADTLPAKYVKADFWQSTFANWWQFMAMLLLPLGAILVTSLISQIEVKNNTWKQLHSTPQAITQVYFSKLCLILLMLLQFFFIYLVGFYCSMMIPAVFLKSVPFPTAAFPTGWILNEMLNYYFLCLPIVLLQYALGLQFKNFMVPLGIGIALFIAMLIALRWKHGHTIPYIYPSYYFAHKGSASDALRNKVGIDDSLYIKTYVFSSIYSLVFLLGGYFSYIYKKDKC